MGNIGTRKLAWAFLQPTHANIHQYLFNNPIISCVKSSSYFQSMQEVVEIIRVSLDQSFLDQK